MTTRLRARMVSAALAAMLAGVSAAGTVLVTVEEALGLAFPGGAADRQTHFLTEAQRRRASEMAGTDLGGKMVTRFVVTVGRERVGFGYVDTHRVRTLPETVLVILGGDGTVRRVEVVAFREPLDYLPPQGWYRQFDGGRLTDELTLKRSIRPITGATLTARSTTDAVRRVLAIHEVLESGGSA